MSDRGLAYLTLGIALASLYVNIKTAMALQEAATKVDKIAGTGTAIGNLGAALGWS